MSDKYQVDIIIAMVKLFLYNFVQRCGLVRDIQVFLNLSKTVSNIYFENFHQMVTSLLICAFVLQYISFTELILTVLS